VHSLIAFILLWWNDHVIDEIFIFVIFFISVSLVLQDAVSFSTDVEEIFAFKFRFLVLMFQRHPKMSWFCHRNVDHE